MSDISADLRTRIAAVIEAHDPCGLPGGIDCSCGQGFRPDSGSWVERGVEANRLWSEHLADAVIRELNLAKPCESGCMWQIPNHVEDMTSTQQELLKRTDDE